MRPGNILRSSCRRLLHSLRLHSTFLATVLIVSILRLLVTLLETKCASRIYISVSFRTYGAEKCSSLRCAGLSTVRITAKLWFLVAKLSAIETLLACEQEQCTLRTYITDRRSGNCARHVVLDGKIIALLLAYGMLK